MEVVRRLWMRIIWIGPIPHTIYTRESDGYYGFSHVVEHRMHKWVRRFWNPWQDSFILTNEGRTP